MVTYNKDEAARLVAELRADDNRMNPGRWFDWSTGDGRDGRDRIHQIGCAPGDGTVQHIAVVESFRHRPENVAGIARLRNNARSLADQLEAAMAEVERLTRNLTCEVSGRETCERGRVSDAAEIDAIESERDQLRAEVERMTAKAAQLKAERDAARASEQVERGRYQAERAANVALSAARDAMRPVVETMVRVVELDEICDAHPGTNDPVGRQAEADLYEAVRDRTRAVDEYRTGEGVMRRDPSRFEIEHIRHAFKAIESWCDRYGDNAIAAEIVAIVDAYRAVKP